MWAGLDCRHLAALPAVEGALEPQGNDGDLIRGAPVGEMQWLLITRVRRYRVAMERVGTYGKEGIRASLFSRIHTCSL